MLAAVAPSLIFKFISPIFLYHLLCCHQLLSTHSTLQLIYHQVVLSSLYSVIEKLFCEDVMEIFSKEIDVQLRIDIWDSHWPNSRIESLYTFTRVSLFYKLSCVWKYSSSIKSCGWPNYGNWEHISLRLKLAAMFFENVNYLKAFEVHTFGTFFSMSLFAQSLLPSILMDFFNHLTICLFI